MSRKELIIVGLLALVSFTHILDFMIMMPLGNILMPKWNIGTTAFSHIVSAYPLMAFCISFSAIFFADKFDRKHLMLTAFVGFIVTTFLCSQATGYKTMLVARALTGLFGGLIGAQALSIIADIIPYERRGRAMGLLMGGFALASIVGVPLALFLANKYDWHYPFLLVVGMGILLFPFLYKYIPNINSHLATPMKLNERFNNFLQIFKSKKQVFALLFSGLLMLGHFIVIPLFNPFMTGNVGLSKAHTPLIYMVGGIAAIISSTFSGRLADRVGKYKVFLFAALVSMLFVLVITNLPVTPLWLVLVIMVFWFASSTSRGVPGQAMVSLSVDNKTRGSFMNFNSCVQQLGTGLAALISGWFTYSDANYKIHGYNVLGYISVAIIAISVLVGYKLKKILKVD